MKSIFKLRLIQNLLWFLATIPVLLSLAYVVDVLLTPEKKDKLDPDYYDAVKIKLRAL